MFRSILIALAAALLFAAPAWGKPSVSSAIHPSGWRVHTITFDATSDDSIAFGLGPSCSVRLVTYGGSGTATLYQVPTETTATSSGTSVAAFTATSTSTTTFQPGQRFARASGASDGSVMEVWCSNTQVSASGGGSTSDLNGDGLYEYVRMPQDFDGDGTGWKTCECGGTTTPGFTPGYICGFYRASATDPTPTDYTSGDSASNPAACRFHGERIWDDITDDVAALESQLAVGATVYFEPGTYPMKGPQDSDATACWDSSTGTYADTCLQDPFNTAVRLSGVVMRKDGLSFQGGGSDGNGELDLKREGTWMIRNTGRRSDWSGSPATIPRVFCVGFQQGQASGCGTDLFDGSGATDVLLNVAGGSCIDLHDTGTPQTTGDADGLCDYDGSTPRVDSEVAARNQICVDDSSSFVTTDLAVGDYVYVSMKTAGNWITRYLARVDDKGTANDCGTGTGRTLTLGDMQAAIDIGDSTVGTFPHNLPDQIFGSESAVSDEATHAAQVQGPVDMNRLISNLTVSGFTFAHHNYAGTGTCTDGDNEAACDEGSLLSPLSGRGTVISGNAFVHGNSALGSGPILDTGPFNMGLIVRDNVFRYNSGGNLVDLSTGVTLRDNVFEENYVGKSNASEAYMLANQGGFSRIENNQFQRNEVSGGNHLSSLIRLTGPFNYVTNNTFLTTSGNCIRIQSGSRFDYIFGNTFQCGDYNANGTNATTTSIYIASSQSDEPNEFIKIDSNIFLAGGFHSTASAETVKMIVGDDNDTTEGEIGPGGIAITNNMAQIDCAGCALVGFRADDDPDSQKVYIAGNHLSQGLIAQQVGWANGNLFDMNGAGTDAGLPVCGPNWIGGTIRAGDAASPANECSSAWTIP